MCRERSPRQVRQRAMQGASVIIHPLRFQLGTSIFDRPEQMCVQAFVSEPSVETLDEPVFHRSSWTDEVELHSFAISPSVHRLRTKRRAVIHRDRLNSSLKFFQSPSRLLYEWLAVWLHDMTRLETLTGSGLTICIVSGILKPRPSH